MEEALGVEVSAIMAVLVQVQLVVVVQGYPSLGAGVVVLIP